MNRIRTDDGVILVEGDASDKVNGYWQMDQVGPVKQFEPLPEYTYSEVSYYYRCPYCDILQKAAVPASIKHCGNRVHYDIKDCVVCSQCQHHYFLTLAGMREKMTRVLKSRGEL